MRTRGRGDSFLAVVVLGIALGTAAAVVVARPRLDCDGRPVRDLSASPTLREQANKRGCYPGFAWSDRDGECFDDDFVYEVDCDAARAAQRVPHVITIEIRLPDDEVGEIVKIDVADVIDDRWIAYCESTEPEP